MSGIRVYSWISASSPWRWSLGRYFFCFGYFQYLHFALLFRIFVNALDRCPFTWKVKNVLIRPPQCRQGGSTYKGQLTADICYQWNDQAVIRFSVSFGHVPVMIKVWNAGHDLISFWKIISTKDVHLLFLLSLYLNNLMRFQNSQQFATCEVLIVGNWLLQKKKLQK